MEKYVTIESPLARAPFEVTDAESSGSRLEPLLGEAKPDDVVASMPELLGKPCDEGLGLDSAEVPQQHFQHSDPSSVPHVLVP